MNASNHNMLLVDCNPYHVAAFKEAVAGADGVLPEIKYVSTLADGLRSLAHKEAGAIFLNLFLPDSHGLATFDSLQLLFPSTPIVVLGDVDDEQICKTAMLRGAQDFLLEGHIDAYSFAGAIRNIAEREVARRELFGEKERAQVTLNSIGDAVLSTDALGHVTYLNLVAETMTGWSCKAANGHPLSEVFHIIDGNTRLPATNPAEMAIRENRVVGLTANCILVRRDGHESGIEDSTAPIHDRDGQVIGAVIVFHDVSMARSMVLEMSHLAQHDVLTDLPNRLLLNDRITQAISLGKRNQNQVGVLFLDLDGFKRINDSLGHAIGDKLLQSVATRIAGCVRKSDTVSRQGGDEFVVLLSEIAHAADAAISAAKIIAEIKKVHEIGERRLHVTASVGISTFPENGEDAETLIKDADTAMYHAKESGRDNFKFFQRAMNLHAVDRQSLEGQLRYVLERDELLLHYQPKIDLKTGHITSVEALVRWQHPQRGLLPPGEFLAIAEDSGLIVGIGQWVLREACRQTRAWLDAGLPAVPVAVNISSLEFRNEHFFEGVRIALKKSHLDPKYLELELTETVLMRHAESTAAALDQLKAIGVRLAVDDFGTGYSSLSYLTRFPIDTLKLDQSFVRDVFASGEDAIVVCAVIGMGNNLHHTVVAEGVETLQQLEFLQAHGCAEGQGYYFSRPLPADEFAKLLQTGIQAGILKHSSSGKASKQPMYARMLGA